MSTGTTVPNRKGETEVTDELRPPTKGQSDEQNKTKQNKKTKCTYFPLQYHIGFKNS